MRQMIKSSINEIPMTISPFSIGILVMPMKTVRLFFDMLLMPMHASVPSTVAIAEARSAMISVVYSAFMISVLANSERYQCRVKPPHLARVFESLKESTTRVTIGAYRRIKMSAM